MASCLVVVKHILHSMPILSRMILDLTKSGFNQLETVCRQFLWGFNQEGNPKVPLVSWDKICTHKYEGGTSIISFQLQARLLQLHLVSKLLADHPSAWVNMAGSIATVLRKGPYKKKLKFWTIPEFILLQPEVKLTYKFIHALKVSWKLVYLSLN
jgi:hypothetical protein